MKRILVLVAIAMLAQGCALTDASLEVDPTALEYSTGPLSEAKSTAILVEAIEDAREDTMRVGYKKNGFGQNMGDIATARPVTELIQEAVAKGLERNGHTIAAGDVQVTGVLNRFWVDFDVNFSHIEILGNVDADFTFSDASGVVYSQGYSTTYSDKFQMGTEKNLQKVVAGTIAKLVDEVAYDEDLAEALDSR